jgi:predicted restriction endonuclease
MDNNLINLINNTENKDLNILYEELENKYEIDLLNYLFYVLKDYEYNNDKEDQIEERIKRLDTIFKKQVKERYDNCCMITQKIPEVCEVAHIYPHSASNIDDKYDVDNGFYLCKELHLLFDHPNYHMKINPETHLIEFSDYITQNSTMSEYHKYNNKKITLTPNNISYLKMKYDK